MTLTYDDYLTEEKLAELVEHATGDRFEGRQLKVTNGRRFKWDMGFTDEEGCRTLVEFDGDRHYALPPVIKNDLEKDAIAAKEASRVIRIPYWVQLTSATAKHYFGWEIDVRQSFPHGFITSKVFPSYYCEMGVARFRRELYSLPHAVRDSIVQSLRDKADVEGLPWVVPESMQDIL